MKKLPDLNVSFEKFCKIFFEPVRAKIMMTGLELKIFNHLSEPVSAEMVASAICSNPENTVYFLNSLTAGGFVLKKNALYWNTPQTEVFLIEGRPTYLGGFFKAQSRWMEKAMEDMPGLIKKGAQPPSGESIGAEEV
jgi:hypothetical protein